MAKRVSQEEINAIVWRACIRARWSLVARVGASVSMTFTYAAAAAAHAGSGRVDAMLEGASWMRPFVAALSRSRWPLGSFSRQR